MSNKMREEFAAWYLLEVTESYGESVRAQAQKNLDWVREDGSFADPMLRLASLAWQASRESLVINLPQRMPPFAGKADYWDGAHNVYNQCLDTCKVHFEFAGLKVENQ